MAAMDILMIGSSHNIGLTYYLALYSKGISQLGHSVLVMSSEGEQSSGLYEELLEQNIRIMISDYIDKRGPFSFYSSAKEIKELLESKNIDVIHTNGFFQLIKVYLGTIYARQRGRIRLAIMVHSIKHGTKLERLTCIVGSMIINRLADMAICVSEWVKDRLIENGLSPEKAIVVHNAIDVRKFDEDIALYDINEIPKIEKDIFRTDTVVYLAQLTRVKSIETLILAVPLVKHVLSAVNFLILGDGPLRGDLTRMAEMLGVSDSVHFPGRIDRKYIPKILSCCQLGVVTSKAETFGHAIIEPMTAGIPIISTPVGVAKGIIENGETGYIVPMGDHFELARLIIQTLANKDKAEEMGKRARLLVEDKFSIERISKELVGVYEKTLSNSGDKRK